MNSNNWVYEYMFRLISVVVNLVDCMNSPSLFTLFVRMTMGDNVMDWGHAVNGIGTHHCSCDSVNGCRLTVIIMMCKWNVRPAVGVNTLLENVVVGYFMTGFYRILINSVVKHEAEGHRWLHVYFNNGSYNLYVKNWLLLFHLAYILCM